MDKLLNIFINIVEWLNERIGRAVAWLTVLLVILVCFDVVRRSLINETAIWIMELEWFLFALVFLLGAGYALKHDRHVRVDLFYANFSARDKAWVNLLGTLLFVLPWAIVIIYYSFFFALDAYQLNEISPDPGGLPLLFHIGEFEIGLGYRWQIKMAIAIGVGLLLLQALAEASKSILVLTGKREEEQPTTTKINEQL